MRGVNTPWPPVNEQTPESVSWHGWIGAGDPALIRAVAGAHLTDPESWLNAPSTKVIKRGRNTLAKVSWPGGGSDLFLKVFPVKGLRGALQSGWRESKARKGWRKAAALMARGFATPVPRLALEQRRGGRLVASALWVDWTEGRQLRAFLKPWRHRPRAAEETAACHAMLGRVAEYLRRLHDAGVIHRDFGGGNVLISGDGEFTLIDINRAWLFDGPAPWRARFLDLERVHLHPDDRPVFFRAYCRSEAERAQHGPRYLRRASAYRPQ